MMSNVATLEREALEVLEARLSKDGYRLVRDPAPADLPAFLRTVRPDAIATGRLPNLLIEVLGNIGAGRAKVEAERVERLRSLLGDHPEWRLEVVYARGSGTAPGSASLQQIRQRLEEVSKIAALEPAGALLLAWSLLEAVVRRLEPTRAELGLSPGSMIELLLSLGYLAQAEGTTLRASGQLRNAIAHGDLSTKPPTAAEVRELLSVVRHLLEVLTHRESEA